ncbi:conserved hypothetical protein [uncultured Eubacteriales bacterium]|uniref:Glyoxalase-like domain-containing protein n=1 Tax=uncultured Eubacteriales bacterium TaxID=172733 RepID=A0A212JTY6_9FIRM|nr:conserved hypothetical protein [uncultured Eubacteriales bacterium]
MKLDHLVINVDKKYQTDKNIIDNIRAVGFPYEPKWGKGTGGFKVSNLWIGNEYFEMVRILKSNGGGWIPEWTKRYNRGHRGMICLMLDVENIDEIYLSLKSRNIQVTPPHWLEFKWFFNLLTRRMPWRNCYMPFFEGVEFQIGFQQMQDEKARDFMSQYMIPNSRDNGIFGVNNVIIKGQFTKQDFEMIVSVFGDEISNNSLDETSIKVDLSSTQSIEFVKDNHCQLEVYTDAAKEKAINIENIKIYC